MISHGASHALAVLVSILTASLLYEMVLLRFPGMEDAITHWVLPVLERLSLPLFLHTAGLLVSAMTIGFVLGMAFHCLRRA